MGKLYFLLALSLLGLACAPQAAQGVAPSWRVTAVLPHDPQAFTQGLLFWQGSLYESTGLHGRSSLRRVEPATGKVLAQRLLDRADFGEGLALWGETFFQLTWRSGKVLLYEARTLEPRGSLPLETEGWGLAATPFGLVSSDGTADLVWRDPATFKPLRRLTVTHGGRPLERLNELEWVEGVILANVWHEDRIAIIRPATGAVEAWLDCSELRARLGPLPEEAVLNGMAWDPARKRLYVTGKNWPVLYELALEGMPKP